MCGISGFYSNNSTVDSKYFYSSHREIAHRGPDDEGFICLVDGEIIPFHGEDTIASKRQCEHISEAGRVHLALGHRRLSIIDLTDAGHQPISYDGLYLVYNGEIFNYIEIRSELIELGYKFESETDTEVFLKAYHCWGYDAFNRFNGMWAAAIYSSGEQTVTLVRDRFGIKPLYYIWDEDKGCLHFSSEIKGLVDYLDSREINEGLVYSYLRHTHINHNDETFILGINSLTPGCYATISNNFSINKYYELKPNRSDLEALLKSSVNLRTRTDTELGILLSGGIDSSLLSSFLSEEDISYNIKSFTADFDDKRFSEKRFVEKTVSKNNFESHYINPESREFLTDIDDFLFTHEYPVRSLSTYSQYKIYQYIARETSVKVAFSGQGADEIFSGYSNDFMVLLASKLACLDLFGYISLMMTLRKKRGFTFGRMIKNSLNYLVRPYYTRYDPYKIYSKNVSFDFVPRYKLSAFKAYQYGNIEFSSLREYFRGEDRNSMRFSIEGRLPFMDYRVVEHGLALDESEMIKGAITKVPLRDLAEGRVVDSVLERQDKMGFVSPQEVWQKEDLKLMFDKTFEDISEQGFCSCIDHKRVFELYQKYKSGDFSDWAFIWRCFCLKRFMDVWAVKA